MSALVDKVYTLGNLMTFDNNGLSIASFVDIKRTLIDRARQLYGSDIDVSDASVDGQWITEIALIINNTFQAFNNLYSDLNPATAQGKALDLLASFSNISRKPATASICEVTLTGNIAFDLEANAMFIDKNGNEWVIDDDRLEYLPTPSNGFYHFSTSQMQNSEAIVPLKCTLVGAISIYANTIVGFINITPANSVVVVSQPTAGVQGTIIESDSHLRARRNSSAANEAVTILDGIQGALLANNNIIDALVINHTVAGSEASAIPAHSVEVITHTKFKSNMPDSMKNFVGLTIYNRLTPGIPTTYDHSTTSDGTTEGNTLMEYVDETTFGYKVAQWVEANPLSPELKIVLHPLANCDKETTARAVINAIVVYVNNLSLMTDMESSALLQEVMFADPKFQGRSTFYCTPSDIFINQMQTPFIFKPSEASTSVASETSAKYRKTYYEYSNNYVKIDDTHYSNDDQTIFINFEA